MKKNDLSIFTNRFEVAKTLRMGLIPVAETLEHIKADGVLTEAQALSDGYQAMKPTLDAYHKEFIERSLSGAKLENLDTFADLYFSDSSEKKDKAFAKKMKTVRENLRKQVAGCFGKNKEELAIMDKAGFVDVLCDWVAKSGNSEYFFDDNFREYNALIRNYNQLRLNLYTAEDKCSAVAHRIVDDNLPIYLDNVEIFKRVLHTPGITAFIRNFEAELQKAGVAESVADVFEVDGYNMCLTQRGIDCYNTIIGGFTKDEGKVKVQGLNEYINMYNQKTSGNSDDKLREKRDTDRIPKMNALHKMLLSDRTEISWLPQVFDTASEMFESVQCAMSRITENIEALNSAVGAVRFANVGGVFIAKKHLGTLSNMVFGENSVIRDAVSESDAMKDAEIYSIHDIEKAIEEYIAIYDMEVRPELKKYKSGSIVSNIVASYKANVARMDAALAAANDVIYGTYAADYRLHDDETALFHELMTATLEMLHSAEILLPPKSSKKIKKDDAFYSDIVEAVGTVSSFHKVYDMVTAYMSKKPYSEEKVQLYFENATLLNGWAESKERDNMGVLFIDSGNYYLGIIKKSCRKLFKEFPAPSNEADAMEKVCYNQIKTDGLQSLMVDENGTTIKMNGRKDPDGVNRKLDAAKNRYLPADINRIRNTLSYSIASETFKKEDLATYIKYYMERVREYYSKVKFTFRAPEEYENWGQFAEDVKTQGYCISSRPVSRFWVYNMVEQDCMYLFRIYCQDFSDKSVGKKDLNTLYFEKLFDFDNPAGYKLDGNATMYYRKPSIDKEHMVVHKAGDILPKKNPLSEGQTSRYAYDIIKDRRYTQDHFEFHIPMKANFGSQSNIGTACKLMNEDVFNYLKNNSDVNIIGLERGERNLLYVTITDRSGNVLKDDQGRYLQYSLNTLTMETVYRDGTVMKEDVPYSALLARKAKDRTNAKKNWGAIENIKNIKAGYLSNVVHHIAKLMIEYNAILAVSDLNVEFKNNRVAVEKAAYQQFEKAIIDKLNFLVMKDFDPSAPGGLDNPLQLATPYPGLKYLRKNCGFVFFVPSYFTNAVDPVTGFTNRIFIKYKNVVSAREFFKKFDKIRYNASLHCFEFDIDYLKFVRKDAEFTSRSKWTVSTYGGMRTYFNRKANNNTGAYEEWNVTQNLKDLFASVGISYSKGNDLRADIIDQTSAKFFAGLMENLKVVMSINYVGINGDENYLMSPVADKNGNYFCSRNAAPGLPNCVDANASYNLARKAAMALDSLDNAATSADWTTHCTNEEWLSYIQSFDR